MGPQTQNTNWKWNVIKARGKRKLVQLCIFNDNVCYKDQTLLFERKIEKKREKWKIDFYNAHFSMLETILTTGNARASSSCASPPLGKRLCCAPHFFFFVGLERWECEEKFPRQLPTHGEITRMSLGLGKHIGDWYALFLEATYQNSIEKCILKFSCW